MSIDLYNISEIWYELFCINGRWIKKKYEIIYHRLNNFLTSEQINFIIGSSIYTRKFCFDCPCTKRASVLYKTGYLLCEKCHRRKTNVS